MAFKALTVNTPPAQAAHILAEDDAAIYGGLLGQDCVLPLGQKLNATVISNNKVRIADGVVSVGGHIGRVISGDYEDMTIANGVSEKKRNDIIAARFIAGASGGADTYKLVVIQGTAGTTASDPVTVKGDLYSGDKQRDYPLWRVKIEGLSIVKVEQMYKVGVSDTELLERMTEMNRNLTEKITAINSSLTEKNVVFNTEKGEKTAYAFLKNGIVQVSIDFQRYYWLSKDGEVNLGVLPPGMRPKNYVYQILSTLNTDVEVRCQISPSGTITIYTTGNINYFLGTITFVV